MYKVNNIVNQEKQHTTGDYDNPNSNINIDLNNININQSDSLNYNTNHHNRKLSLINESDTMFINHKPSINYFMNIQSLQNDSEFNSFLSSLNVTYNDSYYNLTKIIPLITSFQSCNLNYIRFEQMFYKNNQINLEKLSIEDSDSKNIESKFIQSTF